MAERKWEVADDSDSPRIGVKAGMALLCLMIVGAGIVILVPELLFDPFGFAFGHG